jgi:hypothetical protein
VRNVLGRRHDYSPGRGDGRPGTDESAVPAEAIMLAISQCVIRFGPGQTGPARDNGRAARSCLSRLTAVTHHGRLPERQRLHGGLRLWRRSGIGRRRGQLGHRTGIQALRRGSRQLGLGGVRSERR